LEKLVFRTVYTARFVRDRRESQRGLRKSFHNRVRRRVHILGQPQPHGT
jgi:hypothetical protein